MSSRVSQTGSAGADANLSRRSQLKIERDPNAGDYQAATIGFTSPATIADSANGLGLYGVGDTIDVRGSALNSRRYVAVTVSVNSITVRPAMITTEAAGPAIIVLRDS